MTPVATPLEQARHWLSSLREHVVSQRVDLVELFDVYAGEALFGREILQENLQALPVGASVLEVGAGSMMLSTVLAREGFSITALEPVAEGFSHFTELQALVLQRCAQEPWQPQVLALPAEQLQQSARYDFAFSVNVMEHVSDYPLVLTRVIEALKPTACYRFTCPNYLFPYEPHFNIPIVLTKKITAKVFSRLIFSKAGMSDPQGTWNSLNWISTHGIRRHLECLPGISFGFSNTLFRSMVLRTTSDPGFAARRSIWLNRLLRMVTRLRLDRLISLLPAVMLPIVDCSIRRNPSTPS